MRASSDKGPGAGERSGRNEAQLGGVRARSAGRGTNESAQDEEAADTDDDENRESNGKPDLPGVRGRWSFEV